MHAVGAGSGRLWNALVCFGMLWEALEGFGRHGKALGGFWMFWDALEGFGSVRLCKALVQWMLWKVLEALGVFERHGRLWNVFKALKGFG